MAKTLLYVGMRWDYGDPARGESFEHWNFHETLRTYCDRRGWRFLHYDFMQRGAEIGLAAMTQELYDLCRRERPELLFSVLFDFHRDPAHAVFKQISDLGTVTIQWFCDDHWRFERYSQHVAPHFDLVCTTASSALPKFQALGLGAKVIKSQWACNHELYVPADGPREFEMSFVGMNHGNRQEVIDRVHAAGLPLTVFGHGWEHYPRASFQDMVRIFARSKINLNLSNASVMTGQQIKGRNFEVPGTRAFLLSGQADNLGDYFEEGKEVVTYATEDEMIEKARFYLANDSAREAIADAAYRRTLAEHTWHHRFDEIFARAGARRVPAADSRLPAPQAEPLVSVVIPCHNHARFLPEAVASVVAQTDSRWELLIVNDGSPDDTSAVARRLIAEHPERAIRLVEKANGGLADARNAGIREARGTWILPLDSDDCLAPTFIEKALAVVAAEPGVDVVTTDLQEFGARSGRAQPTPFSATGILQGNHLSYCALYRRAMWERVGGYDVALPLGFEDWNWWIACSANGLRVHILSEPLFLYRIHETGSMLTKVMAHAADVIAAMHTRHPDRYGRDQVVAAHAQLQRMHPEVLAAIEHKLALFPRESALHLWKGLWLEGQGRTAEAVASHRRAAELARPGDWQAAWRLSQLGASAAQAPVAGPRAATIARSEALIAEGRLDEAEALCRELVRTDRRHAEAQNHLGFIAYRRGHLELAEHHFRHAMSLDPRNLAAGQNLVDVYLDLKWYEDAAELVSTLMRDFPGDPDWPALIATIKREATRELERQLQSGAR
jgi:Flp pilus assembly protein TadD